MKRLTKLTSIAVIFVVCAILTLPVWGMGLAVFLDSERTVISRTSSPDGRRVAQIEQIIVGGVPSIVVVLRDRWMPNWYLTGCVVASHYTETHAQLAWTSNNSVTIISGDDPRFWNRNGAPFHPRHCADVTETLVRRTS